MTLRSHLKELRREGEREKLAELDQDVLAAGVAFQLLLGGGVHTS